MLTGELYDSSIPSFRILASDAAISANDWTTRARTRKRSVIASLPSFWQIQWCMDWAAVLLRLQVQHRARETQRRTWGFWNGGKNDINWCPGL